MPRQDILDDPGSACPQLRQFLGGYFHEDWVAERQRWEEIVDDFVAESPRTTVMECTEELGELVDVDLTDGELAAVLEGLGCSVDPSAFGMQRNQWLAAVRRRLAAAL